jgi:hypothetical protein
MRRKTADGKFARERSEPWTPDRWNDGYKDNRGRFRVYRPDYPRAYALGYALRAHVHWWLQYGAVHPLGTNLHHLNGDKLDDRIENLAMLKHAEHSKEHNPRKRLVQNCQHCNADFEVMAWRNRQRKKEGYGEVKFCSQSCYWAAGGRWRNRK